MIKLHDLVQILLHERYNQNWPKRAACQDAPHCLPHIRLAAAIYFTCQWHNPNKPVLGSTVKATWPDRKVKTLAVSISWNHRRVPMNVSWPLCESRAGAHLTQTPVGSWKRLIQVTWAVLSRLMSLFRRTCIFIKLHAELNPFYHPCATSRAKWKDLDGWTLWASPGATNTWLLLISAPLGEVEYDLEGATELSTLKRDVWQQQDKWKATPLGNHIAVWILQRWNDFKNQSCFRDVCCQEKTHHPPKHRQSTSHCPIWMNPCTCFASLRPPMHCAQATKLPHSWAEWISRSGKFTLN